MPRLIINLLIFFEFGLNIILKLAKLASRIFPIETSLDSLPGGRLGMAVGTMDKASARVRDEGRVTIMCASKNPFMQNDRRCFAHDDFMICFMSYFMCMGMAFMINGMMISWPFWMLDPLKGGANFECPPFPPR